MTVCLSLVRFLFISFIELLVIWQWCSHLVKRKHVFPVQMLCMYEAPGLVPGISIRPFLKILCRAHHAKMIGNTTLKIEKTSCQPWRMVVWRNWVCSNNFHIVKRFHNVVEIFCLDRNSCFDDYRISRVLKQKQHLLQSFFLKLSTYTCAQMT